MPKPTRTLTPTPWFNLAFLNTLDPILRIVLGVITLIGALYGFVRVIADLVEALQPPRLNLYMSDNAWLVAEPNDSELAINVQFVVYNPGRRMVVLRYLEAELTRPKWSAERLKKTFEPQNFKLPWSIFIQNDPLEGYRVGGVVFAKPVASHESYVLGVQFRGSYNQNDSFRTHSSFDWFPGKYILRLYGHLNDSDRPIPLSPRSGLEFELDKSVSERLSPPGPFSESFSGSVQLLYR
jgi:hypothetical protein